MKKGGQIIADAVLRFSGDFKKLESASGMLLLGHFFGWKVLYIIHSKRTIRLYEGILGIKVREVFPETGVYSMRSLGFRSALEFKNYWKVVGGDIKIPCRHGITL